jgi:KUP system potassium uptake protein
VVPQALLHNMKHNCVLHQRNVMLTVHFHEEPWIEGDRRVSVEPIAPGFWRVAANFGFMNDPDIPKTLELCAAHGLAIDLFATSFFLSRETVVHSGPHTMSRWREHLFDAMSRNAGRAADYFRLPNNSVIELGSRVQL